MASRNWHKANNYMHAILRLSQKIEDVTVHCSLNKNSILKSKLSEMESERERLYDELKNHCAEWLKSLEAA